MVAAVFLSLLSGCAYFVRKDCQDTNWQEAGYEESAAGGRRDVFYTHQQRCADVEAAIPETDWNRGFAEGHRAYCSERGGHEAGRNGRMYTGVCRGPSARAFELGYRAGLTEYCPRAGYAEGEDGAPYAPGLCAERWLADAYRDGYRRGLRPYCRPERASSLGRSGAGYRNVCAGHGETSFLEFYRAGTQARTIAQRLQDKQRERDRHQEELRRKKKLGYDVRWERKAIRDAKRDIAELTRQLTVIEARYQRL